MPLFAVTLDNLAACRAAGVIAVSWFANAVARRVSA